MRWIVCLVVCALMAGIGAVLFDVVTASPRPSPTATLPIAASFVPGVSKDECRKTFGEPIRQAMHYNSSDYSIVGEYWVYPARIGNRPVEMFVWWNLETEKASRVYAYDLDSGEVLR